MTVADTEDADMRAVYVEVPEELIRDRRRRDVDKFDEMWDGELHMSPLPSWEHQRFDRGLARFFMLHWEDLGEGVTCSHVGVKAPGTPDVDVAGELVPRDYKGPDQVFLLKGHEDRVQGGWIVGPPDALIEIRSPGDETYKKFPFYHSLGVPEVIVVHRDTKGVEVYMRGPVEYDRVPTDPDGSVASRILDTSFRTELDPGSKKPVLRLRRLRFPDREGVA